MSQSIRNVLVIGAGGVGGPVVAALREAGYTVSVLTREASNAQFASDVKVFRSDYSASSIREAVEGQDAIASTINAREVHTQQLIIDAAIEAGVKVFLPSEYGVDTANPNVEQVMPFVEGKRRTVEYLKSLQDKISWTSIITGSLFDWAFEAGRGFGGWDITRRKTTIFDGGNVPFEATNLGQAAQAVVAVLQNPEAVRNQFVYVNSFTVTQNQVLAAFECATGDKFTVSHESVEKSWNDAAATLRNGDPEKRQQAVFDMIIAAFYGKGGIANYSANRGLWNEKLGLPNEDLDQVVRELVQRNKW